MATIAETMKELKVTGDCRLAGRLSDYLRSRGLRYADQVAMAARHGISETDWEDMMYQADMSEGEA